MWERPAQPATVQVGPLEVNVPSVPGAWWVVDGQQRATALVATLRANVDVVNPAFRIFFDAREERFVSAGRGEAIPDHWLALNADITGWQRQHPELPDAEIRACESFSVAIRDYRIPVYVVQGDEERAVIDIFDRLNTFRNRLTRAEVVNALSGVDGQMEPLRLEALAARVRGFGFGPIEGRVLAQTVQAVRGEHVDGDLDGSFPSDEERGRAFTQTELVLGHVIDFLRDECGIPHVRVLPYSACLPVLARFVARSGPPSGRPRQLLARWVWRVPVAAVAKPRSHEPLGAWILRRAQWWRDLLEAVGDDPMSSAMGLLEHAPAGDTAWKLGLDPFDLPSW